MSQSFVSDTYGYGNESRTDGSKPMVSGMDMMSICEALKPMADPIIASQLEECKAKLKEAQERIKELKETCVEQSVDLHNLRKENKELREQLKVEEKSGSNSGFFPIYDPRMFEDKNGQHPFPQYLQQLWDKLYLHSTYTLENGEFYIENATSALVIYKFLHESNRIPYNFTGTYNDFCTIWNANLVSRHLETNRVESLTCKGESLKATYNQSIWKNVSIGAIEKKTNLDKKHERAYNKANCIITRIVHDISTLAAV